MGSFLNIIKTLDAQEMGLHVVSDKELKKIQRLLLKTIIDIADVCKKYDIDWSLCGGSLLGAVRHKGFIPWDDDADICMTRKNFNKFKQVFSDLSDSYELKIPGDSGYGQHFPSVAINNTKMISIQSTGKETKLSLDIYILENTYNNKLLRMLHGVQCTILLFIKSVVYIDVCKEFMMKYAANNKELQKAIKKRAFFAKFFKFYSLEQWIAICDRCFSKVKNDVSTFVVSPGGRKHYFGEIYNREKICDICDAEFEGIQLKIPKDADYLLNKLYGNNYMTPPPQDKIEKHAYVKLNLSGIEI